MSIYVCILVVCGYHHSSVLIVKFQNVQFFGWKKIFFSCLKSFNVDLISGKSKDIALHLNPRLNSKAFVRNSFLQESWGEEERNITCFPFSPGMYFEVRLHFGNGTGERIPGAGLRHMVCADQALLCRCVWVLFWDCTFNVRFITWSVQMANPIEWNYWT